VGRDIGDGVELIGREYIDTILAARFRKMQERKIRRNWISGRIIL
jgi:hypothetical protein